MGSGDVTSAPYSAQASGGGWVTVPQGSTISDIAPTLTNFTQQPGMNWGQLLKGIVGDVTKGYQAGMPPTAGPGTGAAMSVPVPPKGGVTLGGPAPQIPNMLGQVDPVALKTAAMMLKSRLMGF